MTAKEYLSQAYRLDLRINSHIEEAAQLRELVTSIGSSGVERSYNPNRPTEAPYVRAVEKLWDLEREINAEIDRLVDLKKQIHNSIDAVENPNERMVLRCRYINNWSWGQIGEALYADERTIRRWHGRGLQHIKVPNE